MHKRIKLIENRQIFDVQTTEGFIDFLESKSLDIPDSLRGLAKTIETMTLTKEKLEFLSSHVPVLVKKVRDWFVIDATPLFSYLDKLKKDYSLSKSFNFTGDNSKGELDLTSLSLIQQLDVMQQKNAGHPDLQILYDFYHNKNKLTNEQSSEFENHLADCDKCKNMVQRLGFLEA